MALAEGEEHRHSEGKVAACPTIEGRNRAAQTLGKMWWSVKNEEIKTIKVHVEYLSAETDQHSPSLV